MKQSNVIHQILTILVLGATNLYSIQLQAEEEQTSTIAQLFDEKTEEVKRKSSYLGLGGNISGDGDTTALSGGGLAVLGKIGLFDYLSIHTTAIINDKVAGEVSLTGQLPIRDKSGGKIIMTPFIGGGILIHEKIDPLATAGVTVPLSSDITGIVKLNLGFTEKETDIGIILGIGYNFKLF
jgi:hypothetical protein